MAVYRGGNHGNDFFCLLLATAEIFYEYCDGISIPVWKCHIAPVVDRNYLPARVGITRTGAVGESP